VPGRRTGPEPSLPSAKPPGRHRRRQPRLGSDSATGFRLFRRTLRRVGRRRSRGPLPGSGLERTGARLPGAIPAEEPW